MQIYYESTEQFFKLKTFVSVQQKITTETHQQIKPIITIYTKKQLTYLKTWLLNFILYDIEGNWLDRFTEIFINKDDSNSLKSFILRYGETIGTEKYNEKCESTKNNKSKYIEKHGKDAWTNIVQNRPKYSLESQIEFYGELEGTRRWNFMLKTKIDSGKRNMELRETPYCNGQSLESYQHRYGIADGFNRWRKRYDHLKYKNSKQRYIDDFGEEVGSIICRQIKANITIDRFISKYGEIDGPIRFELVKKKCGITLDKMIIKYGIEEGTNRYNSWASNSIISGKFRSTKSYSKSSQELFWKIYEELLDNVKAHIFFAELNEEVFIYVPSEFNYSRQCFYPDFKCQNLIIEYDGKYWHDPEKDLERDNVSRQMGFIVLRIDHQEYKQNIAATVKKCLNFIYENAQIE